MVLAIGAGVGRTGTRSLQSALETILGGKCYHMFEIGKRPKDIQTWKNSARGEMPNWNLFLSSWSAVVDWPAAAYWKEISNSFPEAMIILSIRDPDEWWQSASNTIFRALREAKPGVWRDMVFETLDSRFTSDITNRKKCITAFIEHCTDVKKTANPDRLLEWHPKDGWTPICRFLKRPTPDTNFPHLNDLESFKKRIFSEKNKNIANERK